MIVRIQCYSFSKSKFKLFRMEEVVIIFQWKITPCTFFVIDCLPVNNNIKCHRIDQSKLFSNSVFTNHGAHRGPIEV